VRGDRRRLARLTDLPLATLTGGPLHGGAVDVARTQPRGEVIGVGVWEGPTDTTPWWVRVRNLPRLARAFGIRELPASLRSLRAFAAVRPRVPHWYLAEIAVSPKAQGLGVGTALLEHRLGVIDQGVPLPAFLEATTDGSRRLYARWGFEPTGDVVVDGITATAMTRPAATQE
jgi:GNAT superfamily N-acetyltransferase